MHHEPFCVGQRQQIVEQHKSLSHFSFDTGGAKEKFTKENAERDISRSAEREEDSAPSTSQTFEKV